MRGTTERCLAQDMKCERSSSPTFFFIVFCYSRTSPSSPLIEFIISIFWDSSISSHVILTRLHSYNTYRLRFIGGIVSMSKSDMVRGKECQWNRFLPFLSASITSRLKS